MYVLKRELRANFKSLIIWCIAVVVMIFGGMSKFSALNATDQQINSLVASMPKAVRMFIGGGSFDLTTASGYYGVLFMYLLLMAAIYAVTLGTGIISKEERDRTAEFLLVKPISRQMVIFQKLIAVLINTLIFDITTFFITIRVFNIMSNEKNFKGNVFLLIISMFLVQLIFISLGTALSSVYQNAKRSTGIGIWILLGTYLVYIMINMSSNLDFLKIFTPFAYFDTEGILHGEELYFGSVILSIAIFIILTVVTFIEYQKRDLKI